MLLKEPIDVVCVLTPSGMHPIHAMHIMQRYGKHIVVEEPLALRLADNVAMREVAWMPSKKIFPVYQHRYNKAVQLVRDAIQTGAMGAVAVATVRVRWCRPQTYYDRDPWRGTCSLDRGAWTNQAIHYFDLLLYLDVEV